MTEQPDRGSKEGFGHAEAVLQELKDELSQRKQSDEDKLSESRLVSDAGLIKGGAKIYQGELKPSPSQIEYIAKQRERSAPPEEKVLLSDVSDLIVNDAVDLESSIERKLMLNGEIISLTAPYVDMFLNKVPDVKDSKFARFKRKLELPDGISTWSTRKDIPGRKLIYDFQVTYDKNPDRNSIADMKMGINDMQKNHGIAPSLSLSYKDDAVTGIQARFGESEITRSLLRGTSLEALLADKTRGSHSMGLPDCRMKIQFEDPPSLSLQVGNEFGYLYEYSAGADDFRGTVSSDRIQLASNPGYMSKEQFLAVIKDILGLIPTV